MTKKFLAALVLVMILAFSAYADQVVRLGVTGSVYDEMWAPAKELLAKEGITLEVIQFTDYVTPNRALADGDIDLNGFQHQICRAVESLFNQSKEIRRDQRRRRYSDSE